MELVDVKMTPEEYEVYKNTKGKLDNVGLIEFLIWKNFAFVDHRSSTDWKTLAITNIDTYQSGNLKVIVSSTYPRG